MRVFFVPKNTRMAVFSPQKKELALALPHRRELKEKEEKKGPMTWTRCDRVQAFIA